MVKIIISLTLLVIQWFVLLKGVTGYAWAWNVFTFFMWVLTVLAILLFSYSHDTGKKIPPSALHWSIPMLSDVLIAGVLAAYSHPIYAVLVLIQMSVEASREELPL